MFGLFVAFVFLLLGLMGLNIILANYLAVYKIAVIWISNVLSLVVVAFAILKT